MTKDGSITPDTDNVDTDENLIIAKIIPPDAFGFVGYAVAHTAPEFANIMANAFGPERMHDLEGAEGVFDEGHGIMLAITPANLDNYTFYTKYVVTDCDDTGTASAATYLIKLVSKADAPPEIHSAQADQLSQIQTQSAMMFLVPAGLTDVRVVVASPTQAEDECEELDPYPAIMKQPPAERPSNRTPAHEDLAALQQKRKGMN